MRTLWKPLEEAGDGARLDLEASERFCAQMARREAANFYWGFVALARQERVAIYALYDFSRQVDDEADRGGLAQPLRGRRFLSLARLGCYVCFDSIGTGTGYDLHRAVDYVIALARAGFSDQVLLSHDVFLRGHLRADGGPGYGFLLTDFLPMLVDAGLDAEEARSLVTANPRRALTGMATSSRI